MRASTIGRTLRRVAAVAVVAVAGAVALAPGAQAAGGPLTASPDPFTVLTSPGVGTVHFTNTGAAAVQVTGIGIWGGPAVPSTEFLLQSVTSSCAASPLLLTGMSCNVDFTLIPGAPDPSHALLIVESLAGPSFADLHFGAVPPPPPGGSVTIAPSPLLFGSVEVGVPSTPQTATVTNGTAAPVALTPHASFGFSVTGGTCGPVLAAGASCTYDVMFLPDHIGPHNGALDVMLDSGPAHVHADLAGDGVALTTFVILSPTTVVYPLTNIGTTSTAPAVMVTNAGGNTLVWGNSPGGSLGPDFSLTGGTCLSAPYLVAGASCSISFVFHPTAAGSLTSTYFHFYNGSILAIGLSGTGASVLANAGSQGGGYVVQGGPNVEANRDRFEWALRTRADGLLYGKQITYRFTQGGIRYVARVAVSAIAAGTFQVAGNEAVIEGAATLASVAGSVEAPIAGSWTVRIQAYDLIAGSNNGAGVDRVHIRISGGSGLFHETGSLPGGTAITSGAIGNAAPWVP